MCRRPTWLASTGATLAVAYAVLAALQLLGSAWADLPASIALIGWCLFLTADARRRRRLNPSRAGFDRAFFQARVDGASGPQAWAIAQGSTEPASEAEHPPAG
jgi:hypothetical protein